MSAVMNHLIWLSGSHGVVSLEATDHQGVLPGVVFSSIIEWGHIPNGMHGHESICTDHSPDLTASSFRAWI
jgi:hypothetical protein